MSDLPADSPGVYDVGILQPFVDALPEEEQRSGMVVLFNLVQLHRLVNDFGGAVALLDHVEIEVKKIQVLRTTQSVLFNRALHMYKIWSEMAGRDAAATIFHFGKTIDAIRSGMRKLPTILNGVDHDRLRAASKQFHRSFPDYALIRHGAGHRAESTASIQSLNKHSEDGTFIFGTIKDRVYTVTFESKHRTLAIDKPTRRILAQIAKSIYEAFPKLTESLPTILVVEEVDLEASKPDNISGESC
ncbi:hypothetical protein IVB15_01315 [Bradyrhizobium sp. 182]|uniref:hypothetical protein n=1 Tax=unclassified Bradyrhizobium TaxID=2631580 RepID=UPI001FF93D3B|nr:MULTISPECIES: hypothetical protein [unclassified Bradyrhizobium]MCK1423902.1 hypothetical protein [Bradyrhizobium sp. CW12]MCK1526430.1 hypothetical protein [Bradyrhizobium sp. 182]MCK1643735.1 hypothetical protein [Bradyrhizobium sp. 154]MCK1754712.1 hypothetical protein [Bradyrhizobium sp. 137]